MSEFVKLEFCELPETPWNFNKEKFLAGDEKQTKLYKDSKKPNRDKVLSYEEIKKEKPNYARVVPKNCIFIDFDNLHEFKRMKEIIKKSKLKCLILDSPHGGHFTFRKPDFYKKELTGATNWFGYKFDTKGAGAVQIIRVCGMDRKEVHSWDLDTPITLEELHIEELDVLPYWLWGKKENKDLHKEGKPGKSEYTLDDTPFTQLMTMKEGERHNHIFSKCSMFALQNGFTIEEFKSIIQIIHDIFITKIGSAMSDSDLFSDLEERWDKYEETMTSSGYSYDEKERKWEKAKSKKDEKIDERRASEYLYNLYDFYVRKPNATGLYTELLYREKGGDYEYKKDLTKIRKRLREFSNQNFKENFFKETEVQLMQMCAENEKLIKRSSQYVFTKNKVLSCIAPESFDFYWFDTKPPTDVVFKWTWQSEQWVEEHKEDLGGLITKFIKELSRDSRGIPQPEVAQWLWVVAGACMIPANNLEKIIILAGGGQNGKSIYTSLIRLCLGEDMFNTSKIFDSNPYDNRFWGEDLDKGICCIIDDLPQHYDKSTFSYLKGALTKSDTVVINEKHKTKRKLEVLPQIIACTNFEFKLYDKSEGMKRRVKILPTEFHIDDKDRDLDLQHKLVLNTTDSKKVAEYIMNEDAFNRNGSQVMNMYTKEKGVLDSLNDGSLCWFANKCRYEYFKALEKGFIIGDSDDMKNSLDDTFKNVLEIECEKFIKWYLDSKCGTHSDRDLSKANCHLKKLYPEYDIFCEENGIDKMSDGQLKRYCSPAIINLGYQIIDRKDEKGQPYRYALFDEEVIPSKK